METRKKILPSAADFYAVSVQLFSEASEQEIKSDGGGSGLTAHAQHTTQVVTDFINEHQGSERKDALIESIKLLKGLCHRGDYNTAFSTYVAISKFNRELELLPPESPEIIFYNDFSKKLDISIARDAFHPHDNNNKWDEAKQQRIIRAKAFITNLSGNEVIIPPIDIIRGNALVAKEQKFKDKRNKAGGDEAILASAEKDYKEEVAKIHQPVVTGYQTLLNLTKKSLSNSQMHLYELTNAYKDKLGEISAIKSKIEIFFNEPSITPAMVEKFHENIMELLHLKLSADSYEQVMALQLKKDPSRPVSVHNLEEVNYEGAEKEIIKFTAKIRKMINNKQKYGSTSGADSVATINNHIDNLSSAMTQILQSATPKKSRFNLLNKRSSSQRTSSSLTPKESTSRKNSRSSNSSIFTRLSRSSSRSSSASKPSSVIEDSQSSGIDTANQFISILNNRNSGAILKNEEIRDVRCQTKVENAHRGSISEKLAELSMKPDANQAYSHCLDKKAYEATEQATISIAVKLAEPTMGREELATTVAQIVGDRLSTLPENSDTISSLDDTSHSPLSNDDSLLERVRLLTESGDILSANHAEITKILDDFIQLINNEASPTRELTSMIHAVRELISPVDAYEGQLSELNMHIIQTTTKGANLTRSRLANNHARLFPQPHDSEPTAPQKSTRSASRSKPLPPVPSKADPVDPSDKRPNQKK